MRKLLITLFAVMISIPVLSAQEEYIFHIKTGKKIIHVKDLGMSDNMTVQDALEIMPELLGKDMAEILDNYDVQIDDKSIASGGESALYQLLLGDVKEIEISKSPSASSQKKGQGGVVNIILKHAEEGFNGKVTVDASTKWDAMPNVQLSYKKDKIEMFGWLMAEYYQPKDNFEFSSIQGDNVYQFIADTINNRYGTQNARFYMKYHPSSDDVLTVWLTEAFEKERTLTEETVYDKSAAETSTSTNSGSDELSLAANVEYKHVFPQKSEFGAELNYNYNPQSSRSDGSKNTYDNDVKTRDVSGKVKYKHRFHNNIPTNETTLEGGMNFSASLSAEVYDEFNTNSASTYISPYIEYRGTYGKWQFSSSLRYQFNRYLVQQAKEDIASKDMHDITGNLVAMWQFHPHQNLRLNLEKTLSKPAYYQVYPYLVYRPQQECRVLGNPNLNTVPTWAAGLNYIIDHNFSTGTLVFDFGCDFRHSEDIIKQVPLLLASGNLINPVVSYANQGKLNNLCFDAMLFYKYSYFSVALSANVFSNFESWSDTRSQYGYYNISFSPALEFQKNWTLSGRLTYYSKVETSDGELGDMFNGRVRLTKIWKNIDAHVEIADIFTSMTQDTFYKSNQVTNKFYNFKKTNFEIGVTVKF